MENRSRQQFLKALLVVLCVLSIGRLIGFAGLFAQESLQMDFAAFYTAGEARDVGLSPYVNHMDHTPPVWDGFALLQHSRFLYPPLVARLFQLLAQMPYAWAKTLWTGIGVVCVALALGLAFRDVLNGPTQTAALFVGLCASLFHPVLTLLERGQVDAVTLLLLVLCATFARQDTRRQILGGCFLAAATLLKLHCVYFLPFLALQKRWPTLLGFAGSGMLLAVVSLGLDGYALNREYAFEHLPRIAQYGEGGTQDQLMPRSVIAPHLQDLQAGFATKDGIRYRQTGFGFVAGATLVDIVAPPSPGASASSDSALVSLILFALLFAPVAAWRFRKSFDRLDAFEDWIFWQVAMAVVLLCSPLTWVMNTVWLLPAIGILMRVYAQPDGRAFPLCMGTLGLLFAGVPDHYTFSLALPYAGDWLEYKYVVAEGLLLAAMLLLLKKPMRDRREKTSQKTPPEKR